MSLPFIAPMLALLADHAPEGDSCLHEIKDDGYRLPDERRSPEGT